jgi:hypothetical protein
VSWCAFSVDLDAVEEYSRAFPALRDPGLADAVYTQCAETLATFLSKERVPATLFVVTRDVRRPARAAILKTLDGQGQELALHSHSHQPALDDRILADEFDLSVEELRALTGKQPHGYRAPSYVVHDFVYDRMVRHQLTFSSSVLRTPLIVLFKVLFNLKAVRSDVPVRERLRNWGRLPAMLSPRLPYAPRPQQFWRADRGGPFVEIPLTCVPWWGVPFQFTYVAPFADGVVQQWARLLRGDAINTSFHLLDFVDDTLSARLGGFNPNLRLPQAERLRKAAQLVAVSRVERRQTTLHEVAIHERRRINDSRP